MDTTNYRNLYEKELKITWDRKKLDVHHIDMDRKNNSIENLILLPKKLHSKLHAIYEKLQCYQNLLDIGNFDCVQINNEIKEYLKIKNQIFWQIVNRNYTLNGVPGEIYMHFLQELQNEYR